MSAAYPPPDATREEVEAWERERPDRRVRCVCGHERAWHTPDNIARCATYACPCRAFAEGPARPASLTVTNTGGPRDPYPVRMLSVVGERGHGIGIPVEGWTYPPPKERP